MRSRAQVAALWLERALVIIGTVLALWCFAIVMQARYYRNMPVPPPAHPATTTLPGDAGDTRPPASPPAPVAPGSWVARFDAPTVGIAATVLEGSDDGTLAKAVGHIEDTAFPGQPGNVGIAAHRDTIFRPVRGLKVGDLLMLTTRDAVYQYRISGIKIVEPDDVYVLDPTERPALTLVTCYPFNYIGHAPHRYIVRADLVASQKR